MHKKLLIVAVALLGLCITQRADAQSTTTGAIQGVVKDKASGDGLPGVTIIATSPSLQGQQTTFTDASGSYKITTLPPGTYLLMFYFDKVTIKRENVFVSINKTTPVYITIDSADAGGETIVINSKAPTIDPTSTTQGVTLDQDYTRNIPIPGRTFESALGAAPGSAGDDLGVSFSGSTSLENQYVVDGVNTTGLTYGTVGTQLINDFIEEIEIITGGYNAEYGRATGGVVNVVTKSGSNEFHGAVFGYVRPGFLIADVDRAPVESSSIDVNANLAFDTDFGFDLGGPIIKDKVWFYVGFAPRLQRLDVDRITKRQTDCRETLPDGSLSECDPMMYGDGVPDEDPDTGFRIFDDLDSRALTADQTSYQFVSKVNFAVAPEHQGQISLVGTPLSGETVGVYGVPSATTRDYSALTTDMAAKWTSKFNNNKTEVEAVLGWHRSTYQSDSIDDTANDTPRETLVFGNLATWGGLGYESMETITGCTDSSATGDPYPFIANCPDDGFGYAVGGPGSVADDKEERFTAKLSGTQRIKAAGNHEVKAGVDIEDNHAISTRYLSGGAFYNVYLAPYNQTEVLRWVRLAPEGNPDGFADVCEDRGTDPETVFACDHLGRTSVTGNTTNWSAYLRDSWQILPNLTFNYGVRYEEQRLRYAKELQNTVDPFTQEELGTNAMTMDGMVAPRLGLLYDWTKEGRSKVYGHWGRFYESIPMDINDRSFGGETLYYQIYDSTTQCGPQKDGYGGPAGTACSGRPAVNEVIFGSGVLVAPGIKPQFMDEAILGVEYEVFEDLKLGVSYQNRRMGRVLEDVSTDNAATYILANPGEWSEDEERKLEERIAGTTDMDERQRLENQLKQFRGIRIFDTPRRDYNALQLTATRRFSRSLFAQASYTYSRTQGNYPGLYSADNGQVDPNITSQYDLIELLSNRDGPLPQDRPHYLKLDSYYKFDFKKAGMLTTGIRLRALSGTPINALGRHHLYGRREAFLLPRGAMGRTDFEYGIDLHLSYARELRKGMNIEVFTDLFNIFNRQGTFRVDAEYTLDRANPVVGGSYEDLIWVKAQENNGSESPRPVDRKRNFLNTSSRYSPFYARLGARLTF